MSSTINRLSPHGLRGLLSVLVTNSSVGAGDFEGCNFRAMILNSSNTLADSNVWEAQTTLDAATGYVLGEYDNGAPGSLRIDVPSIAITTSGADAFLEIGTPTWVALPAVTPSPTHVLFYVELAAVAADLASFGDTVTASAGNLQHRVPLCLLDAVFTPDGSDFKPAVPINGIFSLRTNGC